MSTSNVDEKQPQLSEREIKELKEMKKRLDTDPEFRHEVESQLDEKLNDLPASERKAAKKRFWGLLGLLNPFLFPFLLGKRDTSLNEREEITSKIADLANKLVDKKSSEVEEVSEKDMDKKALAKRFWGLWGFPFWGFPYFGLWGKKRSMDMDSDSMPAIDREIMEKREEEFKRFEEAEKRLAPEIYKREGETLTVEEVKEMKKRWWGLGYGYGLGLGYGWGLGYPWGFWGKRDAMPDKKRDEFVSKEMMKNNREEAYSRLLRDL
jgi:hypothetical protein